MSWLLWLNNQGAHVALFLLLLEGIIWRPRHYSCMTWLYGNVHYPMTKTQFMQKKGCVEMCNFHMAAFMFLTGHGIKARTQACVEIAHFPSWCVIRTWKALSLWRCAFQVMMMHLTEKCAVFTWAWVLAIISAWTTCHWVFKCLMILVYYKYMSWDISKNPCLCRNCTVPNTMLGQGQKALVGFPQGQGFLI